MLQQFEDEGMLAAPAAVFLLQTSGKCGERQE